MKYYVFCCALILLCSGVIASATKQQKQTTGANADSAEVVSSVEEKTVRFSEYAGAGWWPLPQKRHCDTFIFNDN